MNYKIHNYPIFNIHVHKMEGTSLKRLYKETTSHITTGNKLSKHQVPADLGFGFDPVNIDRVGKS